MDGSISEISRGDARGLVPFEHVFTSPFLKTPIEGIVCHKGVPLPVLGPMPKDSDLGAAMNERPWIIVFEDHAQVIRGMPDFGDAVNNVLPIGEKPKALKSA